MADYKARGWVMVSEVYFHVFDFANLPALIANLPALIVQSIVTMYFQPFMYDPLLQRHCKIML